MTGVQTCALPISSQRGLRNVIDGEAELLLGFEFNQNGRVDKTFFAPYSSVIDRVSGTLSVDLPKFIPVNMIAAPPGATHFRLVAGATEVDFEKGTYVTSYSQSADIVLSPTPQPALSLTQAVTPASTKPLFLAFGIEFYQLVNGTLYPLRNGAFNALSIVGVDSGV